MDRYAIYVGPKRVNKVVENIKKYGGLVVSISCSEEQYLIIYKSEENISKDIVMDK